MALGWDFTVNPGESAVINLTLNDTVIPSGFYLSHTDIDSGTSIYYSGIYYSGELNISNLSQVPEPGTFLLVGGSIPGMIFVLLIKRHFRKGLF